VLNPDFAEMLSALSDEGADYLLVGAYAMGAHGVPRATGDIDIWVRPAAPNAARVMRALVRFGAPLLNLTVEDLARPGTVFQIGLPPRRIDLLTAIDGVGFDEAWSSRIEAKMGGLTVPVLGREALIRNKRAAGRPKDLVDVQVLERAAAPSPTPRKRPRRPRSR
jgi:hypothetical protein